MSKKNKKIEIEDEETKLQDEETVQEEITASEEEMSSEADNEETSEAETNEEDEAEQKDDSAEAEEWKDKYIRLYAEFENYKKRTLKEKAELILNGGEKTITAILPILDDFERCMIPMNEILGTISEMLEEHNAKVLIVANESEIGFHNMQRNVELKTLAAVLTYQQAKEIDSKAKKEKDSIEQIKDNISMLKEEFFGAENSLYKKTKEKVWYNK